jgi:hypothetical protein
MKQTDIRHDAVELLAKAERQRLVCQELVDWATQALAAGWDTPALVALAGLDLGATPILSDGMPLFRAALEQLFVSVPGDREHILRAHLVEVAILITSGSLSPSEGVARAESEVVSPLGHPADLMPWCYLGSDLHPVTFSDLSGDAWDEYVKALARDTVKRGAAQQ